MDLPLNHDLLCKRWVRSRREESGTEEVYRPEDYPIRASRDTSSGFEFNADGTLKHVGIGANDIPEVKEGTWQIDHANPDQIRVQIEGKDDVLQIQDLGPDRLTILKSS
jgi:hypothetical protein